MPEINSISRLKKQEEAMNQNINERVRRFSNLHNTEAGLLAQQMDESDGIKDGYIAASIWNAYAAKNENRTTISENNQIHVFDATDSITTYMVRETASTEITEETTTET